MSKVRISFATAVAVAAFTHAAPSFAEQTQTTTTYTTAPPPAQQPVYVQQQPVGTTTTTAAPYTAPTSDTSEKSIEKRPNRTLLSTGVGMFVISYGASVVAGAVSNRDSDKNLFVPVVGPWLDLGDRQCGASPCGNNEDLNKAMIITSGIVQGAGVLLAIGSLIVPESTTIKEHRTSAKRKPEVHVTPVSFGAGAGVGAVGRF